MGAPVALREVDDEADHAEFVAEVSATMASGTIMISGSANLPYHDGPGSYRLTVTSPLSIPISIPAD